MDRHRGAAPPWLRLDFLLMQQFKPMDRHMNRADFIEHLVADRDAFDAFVYTPIEEALPELLKRRRDKGVENALAPYLAHGLPEPLQQGEKLVLARQVATPNHEMLRFMAMKDMCGIDPLVLEYHDDKFTSRNAFKHRLGKLKFLDGLGKNSEVKCSYETIIDFNENERRPLGKIDTLWGRRLVDCHHQLLGRALPAARERTYDVSKWLQENGGVAREFYVRLMSLFVRNAILCENFLIKGDETNFTKSVFLPAFMEIMDSVGVKPLIVALTPTNIETDELWTCHTMGARLHLHEIRRDLPEMTSANATESAWAA
jgi:hypothetical protein